MSKYKDTIYALSTPTGKSAIAIIRISGKQSLNVLKKISLIKKISPNRQKLTFLKFKEEIIDQVLVVFFKKPNSFTGEEMVEINCHGSTAIITKIYKILDELGIRLAEPGEFTRRSLMNDKLDLLQTEGLIDLINSETEKQRSMAISGLSGKLSKFVNETNEQLRLMLANTEALIDFSDEDLPKNILENLLEQNKNIIKRIEKEIINSEISKPIRDGFVVSLVGKPNTGKSSFINFINKKEVSIVTNIPGTTTDLVTSILDINGDKFTFVDTAGIRKHKNVIEKIGIERSLQSADNSDLNIVFLTNNEKKNYQKIKNKIFVKSKYDKNKLKISGVYNISSVSGYGVNNLLQVISKKISTKPKTGPIFSRERHLDNLKKSLYFLEKVNLDKIDIAAENIRRSLIHIKGINEKFDIEKILDIIFNDFCIGK